MREALMWDQRRRRASFEARSLRDQAPQDGEVVFRSDWRGGVCSAAFAPIAMLRCFAQRSVEARKIDRIRP